MKKRTPHKQSSKYLGLGLGLSLFVHLALFLAAYNANLFHKTPLDLRNEDSTIEITTVGVNDPNRRKFVTAGSPTSRSSQALRTPTPQINQSKRPVRLTDLNVTPKESRSIKPRSAQAKAPTLRPGNQPTVSAESGGAVVFSSRELKQMAQDAFAGQTPSSIASDKVSLSYEIPNGKDLGELNDSQLRLYSFFKRGAQKYTTTVMSELNRFQLKNPHLQFPMTETKQTMTGRLTYDKEGNLVQIKMVRWTNIDKLQGFFEDVVKQMDVLQNPPKELWEQDGQFVVFVTLQIND